MCLTGVPMDITHDLRAREWADADAPRVGFSGGPTPVQRGDTVVAGAYSRLRLRQLEVLYVASVNRTLNANPSTTVLRLRIGAKRSTTPEIQARNCRPGAFVFSMLRGSFAAHNLARGCLPTAEDISCELRVDGVLESSLRATAADDAQYGGCALLSSVAPCSPRKGS